MPTLLVSLLLAGAPAESVSLEALLQRVRSTHPLFSREARRAEIERHARDAAAGQEDWILHASGSYLYESPAPVNPFVPEETHMAGFDLGVERSLWATGGRLGVAWNGGYLNQRYPGLNLGPTIPFPSTLELYESRLQVFYSQPLLQNFAGTLDRLPFELQNQEIEIAKLTARENQELFLLQIGNQYLDWALASEQERIARNRLTLAEEQLAIARRKRAANLVDQVEVVRSLDAVLSVKKALVALEANRLAIRENLAVIAQQAELREGAPAFDIYTSVAAPAAELAVSELHERSRLLRSTRALRAQTALRLGAAEEVTEPDLTVDVGVGLKGQDDTLGGAFEMAEPEVNAMIMFRYPLGNTTAEAEVARNRAVLEQIDDSLAETALQLESALRSLLVRMRQQEWVLDLDRAQIEAASKKAGEELKLYNQGRGQLTFVIQAQDAVARAEASYAENAVTQHRLFLQYRELTDRLIAPQD